MRQSTRRCDTHTFGFFDGSCWVFEAIFCAILMGLSMGFLGLLWWRLVVIYAYGVCPVWIENVCLDTLAFGQSIAIIYRLGGWPIDCWIVD
jgi:uncharacterized membrane protein